ncbi:MAG: hypothetical protein ACOY46_03110 [Bacillota bacterium]
MKTMPAVLKNKIRQLQNALKKAALLEIEVSEIIKSYGVDPDYLSACRCDDKYTEALAFVSNAEGDVEDNILLIEEVFLYHANKNR